MAVRAEHHTRSNPERSSTMSGIPGVTVTPATGTAVVVNNKKDGIKKYSIFFAGLILAAILEGVQQLFPGLEATIQLLIGLLQKIGLIGAGVALTSPFDIRGFVLDKTGLVTGSRVK